MTASTVKKKIMNKSFHLYFFTLCFLFFPSLLFAQQKSAYLFVYFTGNEKAQEAIHYALSTDGYQFWALNGDLPVISSAKISSTGGVRDPHIMRAADGKTFYMVATDMVSAKGWDSNRSMVLMKSTDLINWSASVVNIPQKFAGNEDLLRVWAPQTIFDEENNKYMIYWSMKNGQNPDKIYYAYANADFTDLQTEPKQLYFSPTKDAAIDGDIVKFQGKYHLFFKTEGNGAGIKIAVSDKLTGDYKLRDAYVQQTKDPVEGAGVFKLNGDKGFILMYDLYTKGKYQFNYSSDLKTFKTVDHQVTMDFHPRHGTVMPISENEAVALMERYYDPAHAFKSINSASIKKNNIIIDTVKSTVFIPFNSSGSLKAFDPVFPKLQGLKIFPKGPYDLSKGPLQINVEVGSQPVKKFKVNAARQANPVLDGYYADPEILFSNLTGKFYLYPTSDGFTGWSGDYFKTFSSENLRDWRDEGIILDLKKDVSWAKRNAWAPTIAEKKIDGKYKYFYYYTAAQKIGVATADNPTGPFADSGKPVIASRPQGIKDGQEIDPDVFTDPKTNKSYLYWGNGYMAVAELKADMLTIDTTTIRILTPNKDFREGTEVFYRNGRYYFMWSEDDTRSENYRVRYGYSDSPTGKIVVPENNLILKKNPKLGIYGTGHNSVIQIPGKDEWYIVYHRFTVPNGINMGDDAGFNRETCIDKLFFDKQGNILPVDPTLIGIAPVN